MKVSEIFDSIDGEGIRAGYPVTFIRLYGCNLKCSYCDSRYACEGGQYTETSIEDIVEKVKSFGHQRITLTGGEPLIHRDVRFLINELLEQKYEVNIETDGAVDIGWLQKLNRTKQKYLIITLDYKCPSSGMEDRMIIDNFAFLRKCDVLKFVVGSQVDLIRAKEIIDDNELSGKCNIYFSPVFGNIEAKDIVKFIIDNKLEEVRVQLQMHKFIWEPTKRGV